jgi:hypothetical protein
VSKEELIKLLIASAYSNWSSQLISGPEATHQRFFFLKQPHVGDLVMETSTMFLSDRDQYRIGHLISDEMEPYGDDAWWEANKEDYEDKRPMERVYTIKCLLTGAPFRWTNASIIRVVENIRDFP